MTQDDSTRRYVYYFIFGIVSFIFIIKLFLLQVPHNSYKDYANMYAIRRVVKYPARGNILDRNGQLMVSNEYAYDLLMVPSEAKSIDTLELCNLVDITKEDFIKITSQVWTKIKKKKWSKSQPVVIAKELTKEDFSTIQEKLFKYPGYFLDKKALRKYPRAVGAHVLGYVGEVDTHITNNNSYYLAGDNIGISGIEKSYENILRGKKGVKKVFVDVYNNEKGSFMGGVYDTASVQGENLTTTIDLDLQEYGELLMQNKKGAIVAIEPSTGEVLALISSPSYDPNFLVGRSKRKNYPKLALDKSNPLYNRAIMDGYPPGSTFKVMEALVGQQEGVLFPTTVHGCGGGYRISASKRVGCHAHPSADLRYSIQTSCNAYYCAVFHSIVKKYSTSKEGYNVWREYVLRFGFGQKFEGTDIPNVKDGNVPSSNYYDKIYGKGSWKPLTIISLGIGQGELQANALQIANLACVVANRGYYKLPHVGKKIGRQYVNNPLFSKKNYVGVDDKYFDIVIDGMYGAVNVPGGTALVGKLNHIVICGKTGTAQNPHGEDHSVFMAYAPMDKPKIAIGILVENAGFGATWAAPIASLMIEKYLTDTITRPDLEKRMMEGNLIDRP
jgi:penicillin-binding protein 2